MRQRVMIAIALACGPELLLADEPTTGLDVTIQAQILDLLADLQRMRRMAMIFVTHDLGIVATRTDRIMVMYAGRVVETAPTAPLFANVRMPYTEALLNSTPRHHEPEPHPPPGDRRAPARPRPPPLGVRVLAAVPLRDGPVPPRVAAAGRGPRRARPLLRLLAPARRHAGRRTEARSPVSSDLAAPPLLVGQGPPRHASREAGHTVQAVSGVSFELYEGETLGLVGESGCGKSTTGRAVAQVIKPTSGSVNLGGVELTTLPVRRAAPRADPAPDDLPGPDLVAEPAPQGPRHRGRAARHLALGEGSGAPPHRQRDARGGRPRPEDRGAELRAATSQEGSASASASPARS